MKNEIIDRYIYNVTKSLPWREKKDIYKKLEGEIKQKIESSKFGDNPTDEQIISILKEFGDSTDVAQHYSKIGNKALIPQPYYGFYNIDLKLSLLFAFAVILIINFVFNYVMFKPVNFVAPILDTLTDLLLAGFSIFSIYTLSFSIITNRRTGKKFSAYIDSLKPEPKKGNRISRAEIYTQVAFSAIFFALFSFSTDLLELNFTGLLFKAGYIVDKFLPIIIVYFLTVLNIATKEVDKRYTNGVLITSVFNDVALIGLAYMILIYDKAISMNFINAIKKFIPMNDMTLFLVDNLALVIFFVVVLIAVIDLVFAAFKHHGDTVYIQEIMNPKSVVKPIEVEEKPKVVVVEEVNTTTPTSENPPINDANFETKVLDKEELVSELNNLENSAVVESVENVSSETIVIPKSDLEEKLNTVDMPDISEYIDTEKIDK